MKIKVKRGTYLWKVNKEITNIDVNGSLKDKTMIDVTSYDVIGGYGAVSYTHLDVYKRQLRLCRKISGEGPTYSGYEISLVLKWCKK